MSTTETPLRIEQRPSDQVHRRDYAGNGFRPAPCRYCGRPTVEDLAYSPLAQSQLGYCHACRKLLTRVAEPLEPVFGSRRIHERTTT